MSSHIRTSPRKRGGKTWRRKKNVDVGSILAQGIPHLSNSFVSDTDISKEPSITGNCPSFNETASEAQDITKAGNESEYLSDLKPQENETLSFDKDISENHSENNSVEQTQCISLKSNLDDAMTTSATENQIVQGDKNVSTENLEHNQKISENCEVKNQNKLSNLNVQNEESKPENSQNNHTSKKTLEKEKETPKIAKERDKISSSQVANKKTETKFEYISEYSSVDTTQKPEPAKIQSKNVKSDENAVQIGPLQPVIQLVDPAQLEKETEQYYKEMGAIPNITNKKPAKTPCLTPGQIAKITKDYPQVLPNKDKVEVSEKEKTAWTLLHQYWTFVQENPYDFEGWTVLLNHVETIDNIDAARSAFEGFLPLYPYCFAYWMKFSDLELKFTDLERAIGVIYLGTKCVPFCTDLWVPLINKFIDFAKKDNISEDIIRGLYEHALSTLGLSWNSSSVWEACITYEMGKGDLVRVMNLYRRILNTPTKLYNKHWDHLLALVRDYHPRNLLTIEEYSNLKKNACDILKIKFNPPTLEAPKAILKVTQPEDKIHTTIKEKIVASLIPIHEANEKECEKRWKFEEKIKRPYFHVKPLEKKQLKTWKEYLEFEMKAGDPVRIITLFERCLVPCAMYEDLWCKYASYMENHILNISKGKYVNIEYKPGCFSNNEKLSEEADSAKDDKLLSADSTETSEVASDLWVSSSKELEPTPEIKFEMAFLLNRLSEGIGVGGRVLTSPPLNPSSILRELTWEDVRQIYRRAAWIHCPSKPLILMQWAEFEEAQENVQTARELLNTVIVKHPKLLKARIQLIELERRSDELDRVDELYAQTFAVYSENKIRSFIAIRYARFLFKIREEDDKALLILRKALKKDKGNIHLYHHVFDICYQRRPIDCNGVLASVMLALASKELSLEDKYWFCIKRSEFLKEHGTMTQVKEAKAEMEELKLKLDKDILIETKFEKLEEESLKKEKEEDEKKKNEAVSGSKETNGNEPGSKDGKDENSKKGRKKDSPLIPGLNGVSKSGRIISPLVNLFKPPAPPILEPVSPPSQNEGKEEKERHRDKKRRREEKDDTSDGHRHKKKSSKKDKKSSRRSKKEGRHRKRAEEGEIEEGEVEEIFEVNVTQLPFNSGNNAMPAYNNINSNNNNLPPYDTKMQQTQDQSTLGMENKPYQAVPPSWDISIPSMPNYGYGGASEVVKDGQDSLYERYYDLIKQGYQGKDRDGNIPVQQSGPGTNIIIGNNNSYLPPPPMPQGILGESLFNQGKLENLHSMQGKQGNLASAGNFPPLFPPPPCIPPGFPRNMQQNQERKSGDQLQCPPLPFLHKPPPMGLGNMPVPPNVSGQHNPAMMQGTPPNLNSNPGEPRMKVPRMDPQLQMNMNEGHSQGMLGNYPSSKPDKESRGRNRKKGRGDSSRHQQQQQQQLQQNPIPHQQIQPTSTQVHQQQMQSGHQTLPPFNTQPPFDNSNKTVPIIGMNIRELLQDNLANSLCNVPEWLVKEGGELKLSDTANGSSIIRYWPRYMNDTGHQTLFQSLRKTVKWHQRTYLIGSPSENNWLILPKLLSWIGPCNYEKDGMILPANTQWPPEVVDLLHRLIHFSNSQFNSCLMSLYNTGYSNQPWHSEVHEAMPKNPTTACISLGVTRILEMKRKNGAEYLRFPLFPGSLFVMEGACHADWLCQIPKEPQIKGERIDLSFRTMLMIKGVTV